MFQMSNKNDSPEINEATGEVIGDASCDNKKVVFRSMWFNPYGTEKQDLSNQFEEVFEEVPPYAVDPVTGKFLNDSSVPKIISKGKINVQERIQSFEKEVDLYSILEKFAYSGDTSLLNARQCGYADLSDLPNDLNGFAQFTKLQFDKLRGMNPDLAKMIVDETVSAEDIESKANDILKERVEASKVIEKTDEAPKGE